MGASPMKTRKLGNSDLNTSIIGLGCMAMAGLYGAADEKECIATIHEAIDTGVTFIDTADAYGSGSNRSLVGKAIADRREKVLLATKFGNIFSKNPGRGADGRPEYLREAAKQVLNALALKQLTYTSSTVSTKKFQLKRQSAQCPSS